MRNMLRVLNFRMCLFQEFLRNLPDALCCSEYYEDFLATNDIKDKSERVQEITR